MTKLILFIQIQPENRLFSQMGRKESIVRRKIDESREGRGDRGGPVPHLTKNTSTTSL